MLLKLYIKDFALINNLEIDFKQGLNVMTGETGAGKSIIIDAINMIIGERASVNFIRTGKSCAQIEAVFAYENSAIDKILQEYDIDSEENTLLISREITEQGRSIARLNGKMVSLTVLKKVGKHLIDIHGQHQHQSLLDSENHLRLLDLLGTGEIVEAKNCFSSLHKEYKNIMAKLEKLKKQQKDFIQYRERLEYEIDEIDKAKLKPEEEGELEAQRIVLENAEKIFMILEVTYDTLYKGYETSSIIDNLNKVINNLNDIRDIFKPIESVLSTLNSSLYELEDISSTIRNFRDSIEFDGKSLDEIISRLDFLDKLKSKYNMGIRELLEYKQQAEAKLDIALNLDSDISKLQTKLLHLRSNLSNSAMDLHNLRKKTAKKLEQNISKELQDLGMKNIKFHVDMSFEDDPTGLEIHNRKLRINENGVDKIEFLISTNPGEPLKPLAKIVSGGEASRIMLALKSIIANVDNIPCLIFDEIDAGIGGRTAQIVGEKLSAIGLNHQILCVTHSPQIASLGDNHFLIKKEVIGDETFTKIKELKHEERTKELARMLGGAEITDNTYNHAQEMLNLAKTAKGELTSI